MEHRITGMRNQEKKTELEQLAQEISNKTVYPEDYYEITAILESLGWNDARASEKFGVESVFELAELIWEMINRDIYIAPFVKEKKDTFFENSVKIIRSFLRGVIFAMPMTISVLSMLTLRFSLWSYEELSTKQATSIAMGTILSFMCVGGFTQAIARRGFFYINQGFYNMCRRVTFYIVRGGYTLCILVALLFFLINIIFRMLPIEMMTLAVVYFLFLSANWLSVTVMYILKKEIVFTGLITFGIFVVWLCFDVLKLFNKNIIFSQIIGLMVITVVGMFLIIYFFNQAERKAEKGIAPPFPKLSFMTYSLIPYFIYGFLYFTFLYTDRIIAWSLNDINIPYIIWLRGEYELGLDFALLMLMFPMGVGEVVINKLMIELEKSQKNSISRDDEKLNKKYMKLYTQSLFGVFISSCVSSLVVYSVVHYLNSSASDFTVSKFAITSTIKFVFIIALIAYSLLSIALTNAVILFSLSQPVMVSKSMFRSLIINIIIGFLLSRWLHHYEYAVFGLLAGTVVFVILSCRDVTKVLKNLDYYLYVSM